MSRDDPWWYQYQKGYDGYSDGGAWGQIGAQSRERDQAIGQIGKGGGGSGEAGPLGRSLGYLVLAFVGYALLRTPIHHLSVGGVAAGEAGPAAIAASSLAIFSCAAFVLAATWIVLAAFVRFRAARGWAQAGILALALVPSLFLLAAAGRVGLELGVLPRHGFDVGMDMGRCRVRRTSTWSTFPPWPRWWSSESPLPSGCFASWPSARGAGASRS